MTFAELTQTKGWKNFMAKLYGLGAAVVIVGALFKIMHWPGAGPMLVVGLTTEAIIFIFSAFEPLHEELDWTLAYPELLGIDDEEGGGHGHGRRAKPAEAGAGGLSEIDRLLLKSVDNDKGIFDQIGKGLKSLSETASNLTDISAATVATKSYTQNMQKAADSVNQFSDAYKSSADSVTHSSDNLSEAYNKLTNQMKVEVDFAAVVKGNENYSQKITSLNKNLSALNAVFEVQLQEMDLETMVKDLHGTVAVAHKYSVHMTELTAKVETLNGIYGNMLGALRGKA